MFQNKFQNSTLKIPKLNFKQYGRTQGLNFLYFHRIATFVKKRCTKILKKKNQKKNQYNKLDLEHICRALTTISAQTSVDAESGTMFSSGTVRSRNRLGPRLIQPRRRGLGGGNTISIGAAALPPAWDTTSGVASRATSGPSEMTSMASGSSWWTSA
jgi:hypothetical protein